MQTPDRDKVYSSKELIDMALDGHFLLNDRINGSFGNCGNSTELLLKRKCTGYRESRRTLNQMHRFSNGRVVCVKYWHGLTQVVRRQI